MLDTMWKMELAMGRSFGKQLRQIELIKLEGRISNNLTGICARGRRLHLYHPVGGKNTSPRFQIQYVLS